MIKLNNTVVEVSTFPNNESLIKDFEPGKLAIVDFTFETNSSLIELYFVKSRLDELGVPAKLFIQYMPYSRMDRQIPGDLFTLKYISKFIADMRFDRIAVVEPHSDETVRLLTHYGANVEAIYPTKDWLALWAITTLSRKDHVVFPDSGAKLRYADLDQYLLPNLLTYAKKRDPHTGQILSIDLDEGNVIKGSTCVIVDDLCSKGGTFMGVATDLKRRGAKEIILLVAHTEDTVFDGALLKDGSPIDEIVTSNSILTKEHDKISIQSVDGFDYFITDQVSPAIPDTFQIEIRETLSRVIEVGADSAEEARRIIKERYDNEEIILDSEDFMGTEIEPLEVN